MKIKWKKTLCQEFDEMTPSLSDKVLDSPINTTKRFRKTKKFAFRAAILLTCCVFVFCSMFSLSFLFGRRASKITCLILDMSPSVQLVVENEKVINLNALDDDAEVLIYDIDYENMTISEVVLALIDRGVETGLLTSTETITLKAINNSRTEAAVCLNTIYKSIANSLKSSQIPLRTALIDFDNYNDLVFGGQFLVDDLDEDIEYILRSKVRLFAF